MTQPDLSGRWRLNHARSALQIPAPDESVFVIDHREPMLHLERTHVAGGQRGTFAIRLTTDGSEAVLDSGGLRLRARVFWEGDTLVLDSHVARGGKEGSNYVRYSLSEDGEALVAEERFRSAEVSYDNVWWLDRARPERG
jgi:hypothetical protein